MIKRIAIILLFITLLTYSLLASFNIPAKYVITPYQYAKRIVMCIDEIPEFDLQPLKGVYERHEPEYIDLFVNSAEWVDIDVEGFTDLIPAFGRLCNGIAAYIGDYFKSLINVFPNLWHNGKELLEFVFQPFIVMSDNIAEISATIKDASDWRHSLTLSFLPFDWQQYVEDGNDPKKIKIPFGGEIVKDIMDKYFGSNQGKDGWRGGR